MRPAGLAILGAAGVVAGAAGWLVLGAAGVIGVASSAGCGGASCGDGDVQSPEQCDDGNDDETDFCRACIAYIPPRTTVKWQFNDQVVPGFTSDGCIDVGAERVRVEVSGPVTTTLEDTCSLRQVVFEDLPPGIYTARVTPLDGDGASLVTEAAAAQVTAASSNVEIVVDVPPASWKGPLTGTFYFKLHWAGADCATAEPPVAIQVLTLRQDGAPVTQRTETGQLLDGTSGAACIPGSNQFAQAVKVAPFGMAMFEIVGRDADGVDLFRGEFETFIGAGMANPTYEIDVPRMPSDAGVDAGPDAGEPDAGVADAMVDAAL